MPRRERSLAGVVRSAEEVLRRRRVDHVFVGAISVIVFGQPRTTRDVDVLGILAEQWDRLDFAGMRAFARSQRVITSLEEIVRRVKVKAGRRWGKEAFLKAGEATFAEDD